jgi:hypothetical protein
VSPNLIAAIASVIVIVITVIGQWINSRNDRILTNQELDILKKLDPNSGAARELSEVVQFRIAKWHHRIDKSRPLLRESIVSGVVGYLLLQTAASLRFFEKDLDLKILYVALILLGSLAWVVAGARLGQFLIIRRQERLAGR